MSLPVATGLHVLAMLCLSFFDPAIAIGYFLVLVLALTILRYLQP